MFEIFDDIQFEEEAHKYKFKSRPDLTPTSVTTVLGFYEKEFDTKYWAKRKAEDYNITVEEVIAMWDKKRDTACDKGTICHWYMECMLSKYDFKYAEKYEYVRPQFNHAKLMMDQYLKDSSKKLTHIKSELVVGDTEYNITGMIDQVYIDEDGKYYLFDWKTNIKIDKTSNYMLEGYLSNIDSSKLSTYSLQLHLYKYLIEKNTDVKIEACYIVWFGPNEINYNIYKVKDYEYLIPGLIKDFIKNKET
tara:strand:+ start:408 stop:1151 length:744 start_codon:yes stop_codon:yes gene_type:complete